MRRASMQRCAAVAGLVALVLASCARPAAHTPAPSAGEVPLSVVVDRDLAAVEAFWRRELPVRYGDELDPVERIVAYRGSVPSTFPRCNGVVADAGRYVDNAVYCRLEHLIAYDAEGFERLRAARGPLTVGVVLAHEYAHAVQAQAGERGETLGLELQADCFAGAWASARPERARASNGVELDAVVRGYLDAASPATDPDDHGGAFDRMAAFSDGYHGGPARCTGYATRPPLLAPTDSTDPAAIPRWDGSIATLVAALAGSWAEVAPGRAPSVVPIDEDGDEAVCPPRRGAGEAGPPPICVADGVIRYEDRRLRGPVGRWSVGYPVAAAFARGELAVSGLEAGTTGLTLAAECAIGAFVASAAAGRVAELRTGARDLDEVVAAMASFDPGPLWSGPAGAATFLARIEALRTGVRGGLEACGATAGG